MSDERAEAMQAVVDRVTSYQDGATDSTVEKELRDAFAETDLEVTDEEFAKLATAIEARDEGDDAIEVAAVLG